VTSGGVARRLLFVHAHPDDETLATGGTIGRYSRAGHDVTVVTCTAGEQGTVPNGEFVELMKDRDGALAAARAAEAEAACALLGAEHRWLGGLFAYRDSGRLGSRGNAHPRAFFAADIDKAAAALAETIVALRPHVIVTYDPNGGYGHPDHVQAHRVTMRALDLASRRWKVPAVFWVAVPRGVLERELAWLAESVRASGDDRFVVDADPSHYPDGCHDDALIAVEVDISSLLDLKWAALAVHRTQLVLLEDRTWVLPRGRGYRLLSCEWYLRVHGQHAVPPGVEGRSSDLLDDLGPTNQQFRSASMLSRRSS
jgi:N-acetyl-1-D-myo-inositol-2-amino-2-deoxy-alpha-D-glucopyranoside deacetylase